MFTAFLQIAPFCMVLMGCIFYLLRWRKLNKAQKVLCMLFAVMSVFSFSRSIFVFQNYKLFTFLKPLYILAASQIFPIFLIYLRLLSLDTQIQRRNIALCIISAGAGVVSFAPLLFIPLDVRIEVIKSVSFGLQTNYVAMSPLMIVNSIFMMVFNYILVFLGVIVVFHALISGRVFSRRIRSYFSTGLDYNPIRHNYLQLVVLFVVLCICALFFVYGRYLFDNKLVMIIISFVLFSGVVLCVVQGIISNCWSVDFITKDSHPDAKSVLDADALELRLIDLFDKKNIYRFPGLSLLEVEEILKVHREELIDFLSIRMNTSFDDLVKKYRVNHAKEMLLDKDRLYTLSEIAVDSGFTSIQHLNKTFKSITGALPDKWRCYNRIV